MFPAHLFRSDRLLLFLLEYSLFVIPKLLHDCDFIKIHYILCCNVYDL
jgi:hypothetical protein